jgi:hypothetical protein
VVDAILEEVVDLDAQSPGCVRMLTVGPELDRPPVADGHRPGAGVRTIVRTRTADVAIEDLQLRAHVFQL